MKVCLRCGDTYRDHVDFCFVDGEVLQTVLPERPLGGDPAGGGDAVHIDEEDTRQFWADDAATAEGEPDEVEVTSTLVPVPAANAPGDDTEPQWAHEPPLPPLHPLPAMGIAAGAPAEPSDALPAPPPAEQPGGAEPAPLAPVLVAPAPLAPLPEALAGMPAPQMEPNEPAVAVEVVRTRTPEMTGPPPHVLHGPHNPPVIQRIEVIRTPTELARSGDGPTPLEVPRHVVRVESPPFDNDGPPEPALSAAAMVSGIGLLFLVLGLAFGLVLWAYGQGREQASTLPKAVSGAPGPFLSDPPGAQVFIVTPAENGDTSPVTRFIGKTTWNGVRFPIPSAEHYTFKLVLDGYCSATVEWDGRLDGQPVRVELTDRPCEVGETYQAGGHAGSPTVDSGSSPP